MWSGVYVWVKPLDYSPLEIDWETTLLERKVELEWRLKVFPRNSNLLFEFYYTKIRYLVLKFWNLHRACYQSWMKQIHVCRFSCMFCMRYKTRFYNNWYQSQVFISWLYNMWLDFRIKEKRFLGGPQLFSVI